MSHLTWVCYVYLKWEGSICPLASPSPQLTSRCDLLCDGIVNCGQEIFSIDESPEVCRSRVKSSPGLGSPRTPSWPRSLSWSASPSSPRGRFSAAAHMSAKTNGNKIVLSQPPAYLEDGCYQNASAPPASTEDNEDSPPSTLRQCRFGDLDWVLAS